MPYVGKSPHLTEAPSDHFADRTRAGQASWANNYNHECGPCEHARPAPRRKDMITCAEFARRVGRTGGVFPKGATACRFYEPKIDTTSPGPAPVDTKRVVNLGRR